MPLSRESLSLLQKDRSNGFPKALTDQDIQITFSFDSVLFPSLDFGNRPLCQICLTDNGLFVLGLTTLNEAGIREAKMSGAAKVVGLGGVGAVLSNQDADRTSAIKSAALKEYQSLRTTIENYPLKTKFEKVPICAHYLPMTYIENISFPKQSKVPIKIETKLGTLEFMSALTESEAAQLRDWWSKKGTRQTVEESEGPWTLAKALLYFRKNQTMGKGLAAYFCRAVKDTGSLSRTHELLRRTLPFGAFWSFIRALKQARIEEADTVCAHVIAEERRQAPRRLWTGIIVLLGAPVVSYYTGIISNRTTGYTSTITGLLCLGGIGFAIWGLVRSIGATISLARCNTIK